MKIAICFSGHVRTGRHAIPNILRFIGDLRPQVDIYVHTWDHSIQKRTNSREARTPERLSHCDRSAMMEGYGPVSMEVDDYLRTIRTLAEARSIEVGAAMTDQIWDQAAIPMLDFNAMFYSWHRSVMMMAGSGRTYDAVVRLRPDVVYAPVTTLRSLIDDHSGDRDAFWASMADDTRIDDVVFVSSPSTMVAMSTLWDVKCGRRQAGVHREYMLLQHARTLGVRSQQLTRCFYAPFRDESVGRDPINGFTEIYLDDLRLYAHAYQVDGCPSTFDEWLAHARKNGHLMRFEKLISPAVP